MAKMTGQELVAFARSKIGTAYIYGAKAEVVDEELFDRLRRLYPKYVPLSDRKKVGQLCVDCSGLITWASNRPLNSAGWKSAAGDDVYPIATLGEAPVGALVWMKGHIGIYSGKKDGVCHYIAADGSKYGVREVPISYNDFTHWLLIKDVFDYEEEEEVKYYEKLTEIPKWAQPMIKEMIDKGCFADKNALHLSDDMIRTIALMERKMK